MTDKEMVDSAKKMISGYSTTQLLFTSEIGLTEHFKEAAKQLLKERTLID